MVAQKRRKTDVKRIYIDTKDRKQMDEAAQTLDGWKRERTAVKKIVFWVDQKHRRSVKNERKIRRLRKESRGILPGLEDRRK